MLETIGKKEVEQLKKLKEENKLLKEQLSKLKKLIKHANLEDKMDPVKKALKKLDEKLTHDTASRPHVICPRCSSDDVKLTDIVIPGRNKTKTIVTCKNCKNQSIAKTLQESI